MKTEPPEHDGWVITVEEWALVRRLHLNEGMSQREIAKQVGMARNTVAKAIASEKPPKYERPDRLSGGWDLEPRIRDLLSQNSRLPATVLA